MRSGADNLKGFEYLSAFCFFFVFEEARLYAWREW